MARKYLDFDLAIEPTGDGHYIARVLRSPAGEAEAPFDWPFTPQDLEIFILRIGHTRRGTRRSDSPEMGHAREFGRTLYETVFSGAARTTLIRSIDEAERREAGLRIRLRLGSSPQLNDVPWEYLYSEDLNRFLIVSADTPIVRYVDLQRRVRPVTVDLPLHVLAVVSAPTNLPDLDVEGEWHRLQEALGGLAQTGSVTLERLPKATLENLQERLRRDEVHVLHFIGHGAFNSGTEEGVLYFTNDRGGSHAVTGEDLGTVLHDHRSLRLVILNSCEGARSDPSDPFSGSAQALVGQGIPAVIAMQFEITDKAALTIAKNFYGSLADGYAVDAALAEARKAIFSQGNDVEWGTPVLYMRSQDGQLFDIGATPSNAPGAVEASFRTSTLYEQGRSAIEEKDWSKAISLLEEASEDSRNADVRDLLEEARRHQLAANLYRGAGFLGAAEQWDAVLERLRDIEALDVGLEDPEDLRQKALDAIEARRRTELLKDQLDQARSALGASDWAGAKERADAVLADDPEHAEAQRIASEATDRAAVAELYDLAGSAADAERWDEVLKRLGDIESIDVSYLDDVDDLQARAVDGQAEQARLRDLDTRYEGALALIEAEQWDQALSIIDALAADQPGYRGVEQLRERVAAEMDTERRATAAAAAERRYVDAIRFAASGDWESVVAALDKIDESAPDFGDPESLRQQAAEAMAETQAATEAGNGGRAAGTPETEIEPQTAGESGAEPAPDSGEHRLLRGGADATRLPPELPTGIRDESSSAPVEHRTQRRWSIPAWLPGALIIVAADLQWDTGWRLWRLLPADVPLAYLVGLPEVLLGGLNVRVLLLALGTLIAIQPYRYPDRPSLRRWGGAGALATVAAMTLATLFLDDAEFGTLATSIGPWLTLVGGVLVVRREMPRFIGVPDRGGGPLRPEATGNAVIAIVGSILIVFSSSLHWWGNLPGDPTATPFDLDFDVRPGGGQFGLLGLVIVVTGTVSLIAALVALSRKQALPSWTSILGVGMFVYAASFQTLWITMAEGRSFFEVTGGFFNFQIDVAPGVWVAALGGLILAIGHRLSWRHVATLAALFAVAFTIWGQAGPLADGFWTTRSAGLVGVGAAVLVALPVVLADVRIKRLPSRRSWKRLLLIVGLSGFAGYALFALGHSWLDDDGGYWGSIVGSTFTMLALGGVGLSWTAASPELGTSESGQLA